MVHVKHMNARTVKKWEHAMKGPSIAVFAAASMSIGSVASADTVLSGTVTVNLIEGKAASIGWLDAHFTDAVEREDCLAGPAPGDAWFNRLSGTPGTLGTSTTVGVPGTPGVVELVDPIRPFGVVPAIYPGIPGSTRSRQITTLDVDRSNILGSWSASNNSFAFVGNTVLGEQIAFTSIQRWGGPFTGVLIYGDFALRYVPGRTGVLMPDGVLSGLVLTSNIDFLNSAWADIANATISCVGDTLTISGDLLTSGALFVLDPSAIPGTRFGTFSMTATLSVTCPSDFDGSGFVDTDDFDAFIRAFEAGTVDADFDGSGFVDTDDFDAFVRAFEAGC